MQKVYYSWITNLRRKPIAFLASLALVAIPVFSPAAFQQQSPVTKPITTSSLDSHDGLTVAADPWLSAERYKSTFSKKTPYAAGVLAIKVNFRNDSDDSIKIALSRIRLNLTFDDNNRQDLPALSSHLLPSPLLHPTIQATNPLPPPPTPP